jgi:hypothetical protein
MLGWRSLNLELIPLDPDIDRTLRRTQRALVVSEIRGEMGDQRENIPENVDQPTYAAHLVFYPNTLGTMCHFSLGVG